MEKKGNGKEMESKEPSAPEFDPPPSYSEAIGGFSGAALNEEDNVTFVDFLPKCINEGEVFTSPLFECFSMIVNTANAWLRDRPQWKVKNCESIRLERAGSRALWQEMTYSTHEMSFCMIGLRLWLVPQQEKVTECQQIGYLNAVPQPKSPGSDQYESLSEVVTTLNNKLRDSTCYGRILNIESLVTIFHDGITTPDLTWWIETRVWRFLQFLRVFYLKTADVMKGIGVVDFVPQLCKQAGLLTLPEYETFSHLVKKASDWASRQTNIRICNVQSYAVKLRNEPDLLYKMTYTCLSKIMEYIRIIRVVYTSDEDCDDKEKIARELPEISCKCFMPVQTKQGLLCSYESLDQTKQRIKAWVKATGAEIISAETTVVELVDGAAQRTFNRHHDREQWVHIIRLYVKGSYKEPPSHMLPPINPMQQSSCAIS